MKPSSNKVPDSTLLRVHLSDGSVEPFVQMDKEKAQEIWSSLEPARFFSQQRIVIAGACSNAVFVCSEIVRLDWLDTSCPCWKFPEGYADVVELSEADFRKNARLDTPELMPKREQPLSVGDPIVTFGKLHFRNHPPVYLMIEYSVKLPAESQTLMQFLLSKTGLHMRLSGGGIGMVNLAHLAGYITYPGTAHVPSDSWPAEPVITTSKYN
jgi:hypothetical protein